MNPPCVGYLEKDGRWNHIANITWQESDGSMQADATGGGLNVSSGHEFKPLKRAPRKMEQLGIEWRPRTSQGVRQWTVDASGNTPSTLPVGADARIKYKSKDSFGAVLIAQKPITLTSYNDETLFQLWLSANKALLSSSHGPQLRRHGLRIITRTYTSPSCSINAWEDKDKEANMSVKAKANMMGELGGELDWTDKLTDKDWSHYSGKDKGDTVVVFFDGIEVPAWEWWLEGLRTSMGKRGPVKERSASSSANTQSVGRPDNMIRAHSYSAADSPVDERALLTEDLWGSDTPLRMHSPLSGRSPSRGRQVKSEKAESPRSISTPTRLSKYLAYDENPALPVQRAKAVPVPNQRLSMMSTATSNSSASTRAQSLRVNGYETSPPAAMHRGELQRKTGSPSLRVPT